MPVGLTVITKYAPKKVFGLMICVLFHSIALGNKLSGMSAVFISTTPLPTLFGVTAAVTLGAAVVMFLLIRPVQQLMGGVREVTSAQVIVALGVGAEGALHARAPRRRNSEARSWLGQAHVPVAWFGVPSRVGAPSPDPQRHAPGCAEVP